MFGLTRTKKSENFIRNLAEKCNRANEALQQFREEIDLSKTTAQSRGKPLDPVNFLKAMRRAIHIRNCLRLLDVATRELVRPGRLKETSRVMELYEASKCLCETLSHIVGKRTDVLRVQIRLGFFRNFMGLVVDAADIINKTHVCLWFDNDEALEQCDICLKFLNIYTNKTAGLLKTVSSVIWTDSGPLWYCFDVLCRFQRFFKSLEAFLQYYEFQLRCVLTNQSLDETSIQFMANRVIQKLGALNQVLKDLGVGEIPCEQAFTQELSDAGKILRLKWEALLSNE
ncbi:MAG: hypothetical protein NZT61_05470 [Deltaproteobacteria bacterium]|nr:hypothetical protein [Deltaproteobacteria bacterium]